MYQLMCKMRFTDEELEKDIPRLIRVFGISHMDELEERIIEML